MKRLMCFLFGHDWLLNKDGTARCVTCGKLGHWTLREEIETR